MVDDKKKSSEPIDGTASVSISDKLQSGIFDQSDLCPVSTPSVQPITSSNDGEKIPSPNDECTDTMDNEKFLEQRRKLIAERYSKWKQSPINKNSATSTTTGNIDRNSDSPKVKTLIDLNRGKTVKNDPIYRKLTKRKFDLQCFRKCRVIPTSLRGKLTLMIMLCSMTFVVFIGELIFNKITFNGRCLAPIIYSKSLETESNLPIYSPVGYAACEMNLKEKAENRSFFGFSAFDKGYPNDHVRYGNNAASDATWDGPNERIFDQYGALGANKVRFYNEKFRLFWAMFMHNGWSHLLSNIFSIVQFLWIIEPDWGFWRTFFLYFFPGYLGNIFAIVYIPCIPLLGASGCIFSCAGALIPYTIEMWHDLYYPLLIVLYVLCFVLHALLFQDFAANYCHMSCFLFGMLFGFATIRDVSSLYKGYLFKCSALCRPFVFCLSERTVANFRESVERTRQIILKDLNDGALIENQNNVTTATTHAVAPNTKRRIRCKREYICCAISGTILLAICIYLNLAMFYAPLYETIDMDNSIFFSSICRCCIIKKGVFPSQTNHVVSLEGSFWCFRRGAFSVNYCST